MNLSQKIKNDSKLFDGDDFLFKELVKESKIYGEYGVGLSTKWVMYNTQAEVLSVDSDSTWVQKIKSECCNDDRLNIKYIDVGDVGPWGRPVNYKKRTQYVLYSNAWWFDEIKPDLVLIDGRFRVTCFLTSLKYAKPGSKILFDDYSNRPYYHLIEEFIKPIDKCGRQACFEINSNQTFDQDKLDWTIDKFQFVMD